MQHSDNIISANRDGIITDTAWTRNPAERRRRRNRAVLIVWIAAASVALLLTAFGMAWYYMRVSIVDVVGTAYYDPELLAEDSGVQAGTRLIGMDTGKLREEFLQRHPYISEVTFKRSFPDRVTITVTESTPETYFIKDGTCYLLSADLRA